MARRTNARKLQVETLESRALLAGNITVSVTDGVLNIAGDEAINLLQIRQLKQTFSGEWPGVKLELSGTAFNDEQATTINGEAANLVVTGVKSGVNIDLGDGIDILRIANLGGNNPDMVTQRTRVQLPGEVLISGGNGNDDMRIYLENNTQVTVEGSGGNDDILMSGCRVNIATIESDPPPDNELHGRDDIDVVAMRARGDVSIINGRGEDAVRIRGWCVFDGDLDASYSSIGDSVLISGPVVLNGTTTIQGNGLGPLTVAFGVQIDGPFTIDIGVADHSIVFNQVESSVPVTVKLGGGNDRIRFENVQLAGIALDGGAGFDELVRGRNTELGSESIMNIEDDRST